MKLSVVVVTWQRPAAMLEHSLYTLTKQTQPPDEVIVVDANPAGELAKANRDLALGYPISRFLHHPQDVFNLSNAMNHGIKQAEGDFIMATGMEMLFSPSVVVSLMPLLEPGVWVQSPCGSLPAGVSVYPLTSLGDRWHELCERVIPLSNWRISPGTILLSDRGWWHRVRGYDETHYPYESPDADLCRMAHITGLHEVYLRWENAQVLHPWHEPLKAGYQLGGEYFFHIPESVVAARPRNPDGWGE